MKESGQIMKSQNERILFTLIWVKKILQAPELPLFLSLNRIEYLPHTNRMFSYVYKIEFDNNNNKNLKPHFNWIIMHDPVAERALLLICGIVNDN